MTEVFCRGDVSLGSACLTCGRCAVNLAKHHKRAVATLVDLGYTDKGGEQWAPPIGKAPDFNLLDAANARIVELGVLLDGSHARGMALLEAKEGWRLKAGDLEAQLSVIGAGGVEPLRKLGRQQAAAWRVHLPSSDTQNVYDSQDDCGYIDDLTNNDDAVVTPLYAAPPAPAAVAALTTQQIIDRFDFLEGAVTESTYRRIVETADSIQRAALAAAPAQDHATWSAYVAEMVGAYIGEPVESRRVTAIAGIIRRRLWALPAAPAQAQTAADRSVLFGYWHSHARLRISHFSKTPLPEANRRAGWEEQGLYTKTRSG